MQQDNYSFVVRIWRESPDAESEPGAWRGSVDDVSSGERTYFDELTVLASFIRERLGPPGTEHGSAGEE